MKVGVRRAIFLTLLLSATAGRPDAGWRGKVDPQVLDAVQHQQTEFLVFLEEKADLGPAAGLSTKEEKGRLSTHPASTSIVWIRGRNR